MKMKYALILFAGLTLAASGAFAQEQTTRDRLAKIENLTVKPSQHHQQNNDFRVVGLNPLPEIGIGTRLVSSQDFKSKGSYSFYVHFLEAYVRPVSWASLHVGGGMSWGRYQSKDNIFSLDNDNNIVVSQWAGDHGKSRSSIWGPSVLIPATLQFHFGDASLRLGAEALYSFRTKVRSDFREKAIRQVTDREGAAIVPWSYDFFASVSYDGLGLFVKYQPATARQFPEPGPTLSTWTIGICMGI